MAYKLILVPKLNPKIYLKTKNETSEQTFSKQDVNHWQNVSVTKDFINVFKKL